ncbi:carboxylesterase [Colletotrichum filicis]|nr:carboxylesterase [Colletotrichum filicis]
MPFEGTPAPNAEAWFIGNDNDFFINALRRHAYNFLINMPLGYHETDIIHTSFNREASLKGPPLNASVSKAAAVSQEIFRCRCASATDFDVSLEGISSLCTSKGGEIESAGLCVKVPSRFTNDECTKVEAGAKGECIVDTISGGSTSSVSSPAATAQATPKPRAVDPQAWVA